MGDLNKVVDYFQESNSIYVIGSRLSYTFAYYLGWSLTKVRQNIHILKGSDSAAIDWLSIAEPGSLAVIIATTRYPNELIKLGKIARRLDHTLLVITDSSLGSSCSIVVSVLKFTPLPPFESPFRKSEPFSYIINNF